MCAASFPLQSDFGRSRPKTPRAVDCVQSGRSLPPEHDLTQVHPAVQPCRRDEGAFRASRYQRRRCGAFKRGGGCPLPRRIRALNKLFFSDSQVASGGKDDKAAPSLEGTARMDDRAGRTASPMSAHPCRSMPVVGSAPRLSAAAHSAAVSSAFGAGGKPANSPPHTVRFVPAAADATACVGRSDGRLIKNLVA